jgi:hypothetical protein
VLALWSMAFMGTVPIGGPLVGWIAEHTNPRWSMFVGAAGPLIAAAVAWPVLARLEGGLDRLASTEPSVATTPPA